MTTFENTTEYLLEFVDTTMAILIHFRGMKRIRMESTHTQNEQHIHGLEWQNGLCGICPSGCWVEVGLKNGNIADIRVDSSHALGMICKRGKHAPEIVHSKHRLKYPMKRKGPKGTYDFTPITWDEAYDMIVRRLTAVKEQYGPEAAAFYAGTGSYERAFKDVFKLKGAEIYLAASVLFPFGSPNTFGVGAPCYTALGVLAPKLTAGCLHIDMFSDIDNSDLILVWGTDPSRSTPPEMFERIRVAAEEGAEIIVIDPRRTKAAELEGSRWIPIRPGSDGALALGLAHVLIRDGLYDKAFTGKWTTGFEGFAAYVKEFTPQTVAGIAISKFDTQWRQRFGGEGTKPYDLVRREGQGRTAPQTVVRLLAACASKSCPLAPLAGRGLG